MTYPHAGTHYPESVAELRAWFQTDADCLDYLEWLRWPRGFSCPKCADEKGRHLGDGRTMCTACGCRTSVTAGTIFDRTRTPLTVWFMACWLFATGKEGISALSVKRTLKIGSYQTAWAMLHRLRSVLVRPGRDRLIMGKSKWMRLTSEDLRKGSPARGKKVLTCIAVEVREPRGFGRCRMRVVSDASSASLHPFVQEIVAPGATIVTDGWQGYSGLDRLGYVHIRRSQRAARARNVDVGQQLLYAPHRVASLAKRWLLGTHQGAVDEAHLPNYLNEFDAGRKGREEKKPGFFLNSGLKIAAQPSIIRLFNYRRLNYDTRCAIPYDLARNETGQPILLPG